jgi:hypothetical protein
VTTVRAIMLDKTSHRIAVIDSFEGSGEHGVRIPYHLALGVDAIEEGPREGQGQWRLKAGGRDFLLVADMGENWTSSLGDGWVSPSYGVKHPAKVLNFIRRGPMLPLAVAIMPAGMDAGGAPDDPLQWLRDAAGAVPSAD